MRFFWASAVAMLLVDMALAQAPGGQNTPTFSAGTEYVEVPVVAQKNGKHVTGLTAGDFTLQQDGQAQLIKTFEEVHSKVAFASRAGGNTFENSFISGTAAPQVVILAIDTINTPALDQAYFQNELNKYLAEARAGDPPIGIVELGRNGVKVLHDFTRDRVGLLAEIQKLSSQPTRNNDESKMLAELYNEAQQMAAEADKGAPDGSAAFEAGLQTLSEGEQRMVRFQDTSARIDSLEVLQELAQALKGIPGRKTLVWAGAGFPFMTGTLVNNLMSYSGRVFVPERTGETMDLHSYTWKLLNDANIAVYPIDLRRTANPAFAVMDTTFKNSPSQAQKDAALENDSEIVATFQLLAAETGGKACVFRTDLHNCLREAAEDSRDYYLLGFYVDKNNKGAGYHKITVKLNRQKAALRFREGFIIAPAKSDLMRLADLQSAGSSPFAYTSLRFSGKFGGVLPTTTGSDQAVSFALRIPPNAISVDGSKIDFDILAIVRAPGGKEAARISQHISRTLPPQEIAKIQSEGINYTNKVAVPPGEYGVWFVLRDNPTGRTGSVTVPLKVQ